MKGENPEVRSQEPEAATLLAVAQRWHGTPFHAHARLCGVGVDCVQLAAALVSEAGIAEVEDLPPYIVDFGEHADHSPLLAWFTGRPSEWEPLADPGDCEPGDVALFRIGRVVNHCGVCLGGRQFCHCLRGHGVLFSRLDDTTYARRFVCAFRHLP